jgi:hypothetical protein
MIWKLTTLQINAFRSGAFPAMAEEDEDESPHMDTDETDEEAQDTGPAFDNDLDNEVDDFTIKEDDRVFMAMVHPVDPHHFVHASSMVSGDTPQAPSPRVDRSRPKLSDVYRSSTQNADVSTLRTPKVDDILLSILTIATPGDRGLSHL